MDHRTLENFFRQKELSRRQAHWQEFLVQYDFDIKYIKGEDNVAADILSRLPPDVEIVDPSACAAMLLLRTATHSLCDIPEMIAMSCAAATCLSIAADPAWLLAIRSGYEQDKWCQKLRSTAGSLGIRDQNGLLYVGDRLVIPHVLELREAIFRLAHDSLGHFGFDKSYAAIHDGYYWPNMRTELEHMYIPACEDCQHNKSLTHKPHGPLHPLPVPDRHCNSIAIDFISPLPEDEGFNCLATITDRLNSDIQLIPTCTDISAEAFAAQFFNRWYCKNGLPLDIISDCDKLFISKFWKALHRLTGVRLKMSSAYHPQTDGASERSNKTVIQALRYHVARN
ncbi:Transposon Tf2-11 polyprotein [Sparassis crispa]|uniref:Transposon Tf2-11 polyprotein n=1 Tax=Sparassis crispa TaxID=139825 RepID=A0A401GYX6_9APHY|nr:Transposon Tf2-11 polyprotein [Sparassis crispa]GBE87360.1 Transposon Tf2-11 polyprotein [Sparassis crispa]